MAFNRELANKSITNVIEHLTDIRDNHNIVPARITIPTVEGSTTFSIEVTFEQHSEVDLEETP